MSKKKLLAAAERFAKKNNLVFHRTAPGEDLILSQVDGTTVTPLSLRVARSKGDRTVLWEILLRMPDDDDGFGLARVISVLLFGDYGILTGPSGAPIFLDYLDETKKAFIENGVVFSANDLFQRARDEADAFLDKNGKGGANS